MTGGAVIEGVLDAGGGEFLLIGEGDDAVVGGDVGLESDAGGRDLRLGDGAGVLGAKGGHNKEWKGNKKKVRRDSTHLDFSDGHGFNQRGICSRTQRTSSLPAAKLS